MVGLYVPAPVEYFQETEPEEADKQPRSIVLGCQPLWLQLRAASIFLSFFPFSFVSFLSFFVSFFPSFFLSFFLALSLSVSLSVSLFFSRLPVRFSLTAHGESCFNAMAKGTGSKSGPLPHAFSPRHEVSVRTSAQLRAMTGRPSGKFPSSPRSLAHKPSAIPKNLVQPGGGGGGGA